MRAAGPLNVSAILSRNGYTAVSAARYFASSFSARNFISAPTASSVALKAVSPL